MTLNPNSGAHLDALLTTPFVSSEIAIGSRPHRPDVMGLGTVLRVGLSNIERGLNFEMIRSALGDPNEFHLTAETQNRVNPVKKEIIESQLAGLQEVDVLFLNEADWGRTASELGHRVIV